MNARNIIIAIIKNADDVGEAADMLIRLFGQPKGPDQQGTQPALSPIEADQYYSVEVARRHMGYTGKHIYTLVKKKKVASQPGNGRRVMILGSDILRLSKARGIIHEPSAQEASQ